MIRYDRTQVDLTSNFLLDRFLIFTTLLTLKVYTFFIVYSLKVVFSLTVQLAIALEIMIFIVNA